MSRARIYSLFFAMVGGAILGSTIGALPGLGVITVCLAFHLYQKS